MAPKDDERPAEFPSEWHRGAHLDALARERESYEARLKRPKLDDETRAMLEARIEQVDDEIARIEGRPKPKRKAETKTDGGDGGAGGPGDSTPPGGAGGS